ncbi:hypothetical protein ETD83_20045 [Actinomadura soli]|uniref:Tetracyclin repressor-like C-terminal domain-containing protein n=1 Tax=Actinomadura soli TaxID=2508997 RepID=A0A5C4J9T9_9ACTN|nr:hypothetical protein [Actinomadura soli]TMQ97515.1 hypothetical protein ETD83_20045 [Actinomadura soli]
MHHALLPALAGLLAQPAVLARFAELSGGDEDWNRRLAAYLRAERDLGRLAPGARVDAATSMIVGACHESVLSVLFQGRGIARQVSADMVDDLVEAVLHGLAPQRPRQGG